MEFPIITRLGGRDAVSDLLANRIKPNAVRMWHVRGRIPSDMQLLLMAEAERRGFPYTSDDFRLRPSDDAAQAVQAVNRAIS